MVQSGSFLQFEKVPSVWRNKERGANHSRQTSMNYASGYVVNYNYGSGLDSTLSRLTSLSDSSNTLESYTYFGLGTVVKRAHPQSGVDLSYIKLGGESTGGCRGPIQERYTYPPVGLVTYRDASGAIGSSTNAWVFLHQGGQINIAGDYDFRNRVLSPTLGRWLTNDPLGFAAGDVNTYLYVGNGPESKLDSSGLFQEETPRIKPIPYIYHPGMPSPFPPPWYYWRFNQVQSTCYLPEFPFYPNGYYALQGSWCIAPIPVPKENPITKLREPVPTPKTNPVPQPSFPPPLPKKGDVGEHHPLWWFLAPGIFPGGPLRWEDQLPFKVVSDLPPDVFYTPDPNFGQVIRMYKRKGLK